MAVKDEKNMHRRRRTESAEKVGRTKEKQVKVQGLVEEETVSLA